MLLASHGQSFRALSEHETRCRVLREPTEDAVGIANANLKLVFGDDFPLWTQKQVMAWAWPSVPLTEDALLYYSSGMLACHQRDTTRFLDVALLGTSGGAELFEKLAGFPSRFDTLEGDVRAAAALLGAIIRTGVVVTDPENESEYVQRNGLDV